MLLQLMSRLLTFALNQALVRLAPPSVFGTAAIQFDLVAATILFLSREGVRTALLRSYTSSAAALARWPLRLGVLVATGTATLYLSTSAASTTSQPYFAPALALYVFASLTELAVEPLYIRALTATPPRLRVRVQAEGGMAITRAVVSCAALVLGPPDSALLGFALGHAAGSVWLAARYVVGFGLESVRGLFVASAEEGEEGAKPDPATRDLVIANTRQSVVKHVLTEADRIAVGQLAELGDQGGYAVAMNYGELFDQ
jgi:oligosaccharide translocation protein RFT1